MPDVVEKTGKPVVDPKKDKKPKGKGGKFIELNPELPTRFESWVAESRSGGTVRIDYLIRLGLGDVKKIFYYRQAISNPEAAVKNPTLRPYVGEVLEQTLDLIFNDAQLYNRFRTLLQKQDKTRGENELPEELTIDEKRDLSATLRNIQEVLGGN